MKQQKKINYYRLSLQDGCFFRTQLSAEHKLYGRGDGYFAYLAPVYDTNDFDSTFHRLQLVGNFDKCKYEILMAATNADIREEILDDSHSPLQIAEKLKVYSHIRKVNTDDLLLHDLTGRYLWILIIVAGSEQTSSFVIDGFSVEFPRSSFIEYMPEIYREKEESFFSRYMAALSSLYVDVENEVERIPYMLDYETTSTENLALFANWTGISQMGIRYSDQQIKYVLQNLQQLQSGKGTKAIMHKILYLVTGKEAKIVEYFKWHDWMKNFASLEEHYKNLYGSDEGIFTIIINCVKDEQTVLLESERIRQVIEAYIPLGIECNLVMLRESSNMDTHCYLDVNSILSTPTVANTSGFVLGSNYILG